MHTTLTVSVSELLWIMGGLIQLFAMLIAWRYTRFMASSKLLRKFLVVFWPLAAVVILLIACFGVVQ